MSRLLLLVLALLPASQGLAQDEEPTQERQEASAKLAPEPSSRLIRQAFQGALSPEQLQALGPRATAQQLRDAMTPQQKGAARAGLAAAEANAKTPEELKEIARGYLILDENAPNQGEGALRVAETLQAANSEDSEGFSLAGSAYHQMGDYPAAAQWAQRALEINPNDERARAVFMLSKDRIKRGAGSSPGIRGVATGPDGITAAGSDFAIPERHDISPQAMPYVRQAIVARRVDDMAATWSNVQAAMNADPTSKTVQKLYGMAKEDQARYAETKEYLRLSGDALDAGRYQDAVALAHRAYERSGSPTVKKILELTQQTADKRAQEAAPKPVASKTPKKKGVPLWPIGAIFGFTAIGYGVARARTTWAAQESEPPEDEDPNSERIQRNRRYAKMAAVSAAIGFGIVYGIPWLIGTGGPAAIKLIRDSGGSLQRVAASEAGAIGPVAQKTGTVWDSIKATGPSIAGTEIPSSFQIAVNGRQLWVHPNATEHMGEYIIGQIESGRVSPNSVGIRSQMMLESFRAAVTQATAQGIRLGQQMKIAGWELKFSQRPSDPLPVVVHALYTQ
ncbi:MAG: tetratricopeptide repeat protein [Elusimicrobia bacterium]|nr:tetratricopeptide repeat protein [Elusimicrobiota bacterium]